MPVSLHHVVIEAHGHLGLARFWSHALDRRILSEREGQPSPDDKAEHCQATIWSRHRFEPAHLERHLGVGEVTFWPNRVTMSSKALVVDTVGISVNRYDR